MVYQNAEKLLQKYGEPKATEYVKCGLAIQDVEILYAQTILANVFQKKGSEKEVGIEAFKIANEVKQRLERESISDTRLNPAIRAKWQLALKFKKS